MSKEEDLAGSCDLETGVCSPEGENTQSEAVGHDVSLGPKLKLTYYFDALCGWCYGFSPVVEQLLVDYGDQIEMEVVSGGLFLGSRVGRVNEIAPYIKSGAYKSVESRTGVKFGQNFLDVVFGAGKMTLNSLLPAIALCVVKEKRAAKAVEFAGILLKAFYAEGMDSIDENTYPVCAEQIGLNRAEFAEWIQDEKYQSLAEKDFESFRSSGLRGMPALIVETETDRLLLANGYVDPEELMPRLERLFK